MPHLLSLQEGSREILVPAPDQKVGVSVININNINSQLGKHRLYDRSSKSQIYLN